MVDVVDPAKRSEMMAGIGAKNTKPEVVVRQILHRRGYRFRLHRKDLPGKPDIVLPKWKALIFVHGCFWHGHEDCPLFRLPKSRTEFWEDKISANRRRDERVRSELLSTDWRIIEVWECALKGRERLDSGKLAELLSSVIENGDRENVSIRGGLAVEL